MKRLLTSLFLLAFATVAAAADRPNILLIMVDDMGYSDIGCFGGEIDTPNLNRLAENGIRFTQFYNNAKCTTTRASLMTGLYPRRKGPLLKPEMVTIGEALGAAGYQSILSGKWHLGFNSPSLPQDRGFKKHFCLVDGAGNFFDPNYPQPKYKLPARRTVLSDGIRIQGFPDGFYMTDAISNYAAGMIRKQADGSTAPFFLYCAYTAPHYPLHAKPEDIAKYEKRYLEGWDQLRNERFARMKQMGILPTNTKLTPRATLSEPWETAEHKEWLARRMAVHAAMVDCVDQGIGRILKALEETEQLDNTLIFFLSDNGASPENYPDNNPEIMPGAKETYQTVGPEWANACNTPFAKYKTYVHEGGIATPLIVHWPGKVQPGIVSDVAHIIDIMPTCLDAALAAYPETFNGHAIIPTEGKSMLPILTQQEDRAPLHDELYWEWAGNRAAREGDWKAVWEKSKQRWELYYLASDRTETTDLATITPDKVAELSEKWERWAKQTGAPNRAKTKN